MILRRCAAPYRPFRFTSLQLSQNSCTQPPQTLNICTDAHCMRNNTFFHSPALRKEAIMSCRCWTACCSSAGLASGATSGMTLRGIPRSTASTASDAYAACHCSSSRALTAPPVRLVAAPLTAWPTSAPAAAAASGLPCNEGSEGCGVLPLLVAGRPVSDCCDCGCWGPDCCCDPPEAASARPAKPGCKDMSSTQGADSSSSSEALTQSEFVARPHTVVGGQHTSSTHIGMHRTQ